MLEFTIGLPGPFGTWCAAVVARLAGPTAGPLPVISANTLDQISRSLIGRGTSQAVISPREPSGRLRAELSAAGRRFIVSTEDPRAVFGHLVANGLDARETVRAVASSCAAVIGCIDAPGALTLRADWEGLDPLAAAAAIASHLGLPANEAEIAPILDDLARDGIVPAGENWTTFWAELGEAERAMALGAIAPYLRAFNGEAFEPLSWAPLLFTTGEEPGQPVLGPIDITGRARCLFRGPDILVPPGAWSLWLGLSFSTEAVEHEYLVEISGCAGASSISVQPERPGQLQGRVDFIVDETANEPISIRFMSRRAAFDGILTLITATVAPRPDAPETATRG